MKKINLIGLLILASSLLFIQCTSDPIPGPQGEAGTDGTDGTNGVDGVDGTASCVACHSKSHREPIMDTYQLSLHGIDPLHTDRVTGDDIKTSDYTNRTGCVQCHTSGGYIDYVNGKTLATGGGYPGDTAYPYGEQTISCTTCHDSHSTFDFDNDGHDFALRSFDPVWLVLDPAYAVDFEGTSNNCATCHQPRDAYPVPFDDGSGVVAVGPRYGPHHGPQSTLLEGILAANISGSEGYPGSGAAGENTHRTGASCVSCHMGETTDGTDGNHSMIPTNNACVVCHVNGAPTEVTGFAADLQTLHDLLVTEGSITESGSSVSGTFPVKVAQATWNYITLIEDGSHGVHNPKYSKALLKNSIEALQN
jgi:hypothetical protein